MQHKCKVTVLDKKLCPELQAQYCAAPMRGPAPAATWGDEYIFEGLRAAARRTTSGTWAPGPW